MRKLRIDQVNFIGKRVLMRVDYDVPMEDGKIKTNQKIVASLESIRYVLKNYCQAVILISHLGNPDGKRNMEFTLKPIAEELEKLLERKVTFLDDCVGPEVEMAVMEPEEGSVFLLENARFHKEEILETEDGKIKACSCLVDEFRKSLRRLAEIYINDCFASCHLPHSSMVGEFYEVRAAGFLVLKEMEYVYTGMDIPEKPFLAILGGIKMERKMKLIEELLKKVDEIIIAGGIVYTFLEVCENMKIGNSMFFEDSVNEIPALMEKAKHENVAIHFPSDFIIGDKMSNDAKAIRVRKDGGIKKDYMGLDIGPKSVKEFSKIIRRAKILYWNGAMGAYEYEPFASGTQQIVEAVVDQTNAKGITIVGGTSTILALEKWDARDKVTYISTGGEATSELLEGHRLPGIEALNDEDHNCRQQCNIFRVIRPQLENNPFGEVDVEKIREERRKKREEEAQKNKEKQEGKKSEEDQEGPRDGGKRSMSQGRRSKGRPSKDRQSKGGKGGQGEGEQAEPGDTDSERESIQGKKRKSSGKKSRLSRLSNPFQRKSKGSQSEGSDRRNSKDKQGNDRGESQDQPVKGQGEEQKDQEIQEQKEGEKEGDAEEKQEEEKEGDKEEKQEEEKEGDKGDEEQKEEEKKDE